MPGVDADAKRETPASRIQDATLNLLQHLRLSWMRKHGAPVPPPPLTAKQKAEIKECFQLMDQDGSGAIDMDEIVQAFDAIGIQVSREDLQRIMDEVDPDGSGEIDYDEFLSIMGRAIIEDRGTTGSALERTGDSALSFADAVRAFRRKKLIEALEEGGEARNKVVAYHEAMQDLVREELETLKARAAARDALQRQVSLRASLGRPPSFRAPMQRQASFRAVKAKEKLRGIVAVGDQEEDAEGGEEGDVVGFFGRPEETDKDGAGAGRRALSRASSRAPSQSSRRNTATQAVLFAAEFGSGVESVKGSQERVSGALAALQATVLGGGSMRARMGAGAGADAPGSIDPGASIAASLGFVFPPKEGAVGVSGNGTVGVSGAGAGRLVQRLRSVRVHSPFGDAGSSDDEREYPLVVPPDGASVLRQDSFGGTSQKSGSRDLRRYTLAGSCLGSRKASSVGEGPWEANGPWDANGPGKTNGPGEANGPGEDEEKRSELLRVMAADLGFKLNAKGEVQVDWGFVGPLQAHKARLLRRRGLHRGPEFRRRHRVHSWGRPGRVAARVRTAATRFFSRLEQSVGAQDKQQDERRRTQFVSPSPPPPPNAASAGDAWLQLSLKPTSCVASTVRSRSSSPSPDGSCLSPSSRPASIEPSSASMWGSSQHGGGPSRGRPGSRMHTPTSPSPPGISNSRAGGSSGGARGPKGDGPSPPPPMPPFVVTHVRTLRAPTPGGGAPASPGSSGCYGLEGGGGGSCRAASPPAVSRPRTVTAGGGSRPGTHSPVSMYHVEDIAAGAPPVTRKPLSKQRSMPDPCAPPADHDLAAGDMGADMVQGPEGGSGEHVMAFDATPLTYFPGAVPPATDAVHESATGQQQLLTVGWDRQGEGSEGVEEAAQDGSHPQMHNHTGSPSHSHSRCCACSQGPETLDLEVSHPPSHSPPGSPSGATHRARSRSSSPTRTRPPPQDPRQHGLRHSSHPPSVTAWAVSLRAEMHANDTALRGCAGVDGAGGSGGAGTPGVRAVMSPAVAAVAVAGNTAGDAGGAVGEAAAAASVQVPVAAAAGAGVGVVGAMVSCAGQLQPECSAAAQQQLLEPSPSDALFDSLCGAYPRRAACPPPMSPDGTRPWFKAGGAVHSPDRTFGSLLFATQAQGQHRPSQQQLLSQGLVQQDSYYESPPGSPVAMYRDLRGRSRSNSPARAQSPPRPGPPPQDPRQHGLNHAHQPSVTAWAVSLREPIVFTQEDEQSAFGVSRGGWEVNGPGSRTGQAGTGASGQRVRHSMPASLRHAAARSRGASALPPGLQPTTSPTPPNRVSSWARSSAPPRASVLAPPPPPASRTSFGAPAPSPAAAAALAALSNGAHGSVVGPDSCAGNRAATIAALQQLGRGYFGPRPLSTTAAPAGRAAAPAAGPVHEHIEPEAATSGGAGGEGCLASTLQDCDAQAPHCSPSSAPAATNFTAAPAPALPGAQALSVPTSTGVRLLTSSQGGARPGPATSLLASTSSLLPTAPTTSADAECLGAVYPASADGWPLYGVTNSSHANSSSKSNSRPGSNPRGGVSSRGGSSTQGLNSPSSAARVPAWSHRSRMTHRVAPSPPGVLPHYVLPEHVPIYLAAANGGVLGSASLSPRSASDSWQLQGFPAAGCFALRPGTAPVGTAGGGPSASAGGVPEWGSEKVRQPMHVSLLRAGRQGAQRASLPNCFVPATPLAVVAVAQHPSSSTATAATAGPAGSQGAGGQGQAAGAGGDAAAVAAVAQQEQHGTPGPGASVALFRMRDAQARAEAAAARLQHVRGATPSGGSFAAPGSGLQPSAVAGPAGFSRPSTSSRVGSSGSSRGSGSGSSVDGAAGTNSMSVSRLSGSARFGQKPALGPPDGAFTQHQPMVRAQTAPSPGPRMPPATAHMLRASQQQLGSTRGTGSTRPPLHPPMIQVPASPSPSAAVQDKHLLSPWGGSSPTPTTPGLSAAAGSTGAGPRASSSTGSTSSAPGTSSPRLGKSLSAKISGRQ